MQDLFVELLTACATSFVLSVAFIVQCAGKKAAPAPLPPPSAAANKPAATATTAAAPPPTTTGASPTTQPASKVTDKPASHKSQKSKAAGAESKVDPQTQQAKPDEKKPDEKPAEEKPKEEKSAKDEQKKSEKDKEAEKPEGDADKADEAKPSPGVPSKKAVAPSAKEKVISLQETQKSGISKKEAPKESQKEKPKESQKEKPKESQKEKPKESKKEQKDDKEAPKEEAKDKEAPPKDDAAAAGKEKDKSAEGAGAVPTEFKLDPPELKFTDKGGILKIKVHNESKDRRAVKIKCSDNALYRVNPVFLFLEPGQKDVEVEVVRQAGKPKQDKLVFVVVKATPEAKEFPPLFKNVVKGETPMLTLPLKA